MLHSCSLLAERAIHCPWVELLRTTKCKVKSMFFSRQRGTRQQSLIFKRVLFSGCIHSGTAGCTRLQMIIYPGKLMTYMTTALYSPYNSSIQSLSRLSLSTEMPLRCIYTLRLCVTDMMDANYGLCFQPDNRATTGLPVEQSQFPSILYNECPSYIPKSSNRK